MEGQAVEQILPYPTDRVVGIAADRETLEAVREALRASNVDDDRVDVLSSRHTPDDERHEDGEHGALASAVRGVRSALGNALTDTDTDADTGAGTVAFYGSPAVEDLQIQS